MRFGFIGAAALALAVVSSLDAQQAITSATLGGRVQDDSGGFVSDVRISIHDLDRNQTTSTISDSQGRYNFARLPPGSYELRTEDARFASTVHRFDLAVGQAVNIPLRLTVTGGSTSIVVTENLAGLETVRTQIAESVRPREIDSLPLNGRNYTDLALLLPGVSRTNTGASQQFAETSA